MSFKYLGQPVSSFTAANLDTTVLSSWKTLFQATGTVANGVTVGVYALGNGGAAVAATGLQGVPIYKMTAADFTVAGKTVQYRLLVTCAVNAAAPTATFTVGLLPFTSPAGGAGALSATLGAAVGNTVAFTTPAANSLTHTASTVFTAPTDAAYVLGVTTTTATTAANSFTQLNAYLQYQLV